MYVNCIVIGPKIYVKQAKINKIEKVQPLVGLLVFAVFFVLLVDIVNRKEYYKLNVIFPRSRRMRYSFVHRKIVHLKR